MAYHDHDDDDYHDRRGHRSVEQMTEDKLRKEAESAYKKNEKALSDSFNVQIDKKSGKAKIFGLEVPKVLAPSIKMLIDTVSLPLADGIANFAYRQSRKIAPTFNMDPHSAGLTAAIVARAAIVTARPVSQFFAANKDYTMDRIKLGKELTALCEATGADYRHNEMVKAEQNHLYNEWFNDLQMIIPSLLSMAPAVVYNTLTHKEFLAKYEAEHSVEGAMMKKADDILAEQLKRIEELATQQTHRHDMKEKLYKEFVRKDGPAIEKRLRGQYKDDREITETHMRNYFDRNIWEGIERELNKSGKAPGKKHDNSDEKSFKNMLIGSAGAVSLLGEGYADYMNEERKKTGVQATSYQLMQKLEEQAQGGSMNVGQVHKAVVAIFNQLEEDMGRTRFAGGLEKTLENSTKKIAEYIANGRLEASALLKLAGDSKLITRTGGKRMFKNESEIEGAVEELLGNKANKKDEISAKEFLGMLEDPERAKHVIAENVTKMADGSAKELFFALMPMELLEKSGMKTKDINEYRRRGHEHLYNQVAAIVIHLAAEDPELLTKHNICPEDIREIKKLAKEIEQGHMDKLMVAVDSKSPLIQTLAAAELSEQLNTKNDEVWSKRSEEGEALKKKLAAIIDERKSKMMNDDGETLSHAERHGRGRIDREFDDPDRFQDDRPHRGGRHMDEDERDAPYAPERRGGHASRHERTDSYTDRHSRHNTGLEPDFNLR